MSPPRMNFHSPNGTSTHPMHAMYSSPKLHAFGAIDQNPKAKGRSMRAKSSDRHTHNRDAQPRLRLQRQSLSRRYT